MVNQCFSSFSRIIASYSSVGTLVSSMSDINCLSYVRGVDFDVVQLLKVVHPWRSNTRVKYCEQLMLIKSSDCVMVKPLKYDVIP